MLEIFSAWFNPDSWMDVFDHFLLIVGAVVVAAIPSIFTIKNHRAIREGNQVIKDVKDQVVNGHTDPLRTDLDRVRTDVQTVASGVENLTRAVGELRKEVLDEAERRRETAGELRDELGRQKDSIKELRSDIDGKL